MTFPCNNYYCLIATFYLNYSSTFINFICNVQKYASPIHLFIYLFNLLYLYGAMDIYFMSYHPLFFCCCCINCPIPGQWEFLSFGSYILLAFPSSYKHVLTFLHDRIFWAHLVFFLLSVGINHSSKTSTSFLKRMASRNQDLDTGSPHA